MPATIVRCSLPASTVILTSFFDFGTASAASTLATRNSTFMKSSNPIRESSAGACAGCGAAAVAEATAAGPTADAATAVGDGCAALSLALLLPAGGCCSGL